MSEGRAGKNPADSSGRGRHDRPAHPHPHPPPAARRPPSRQARTATAPTITSVTSKLASAHRKTRPAPSTRWPQPTVLAPPVSRWCSPASSSTTRMTDAARPRHPSGACCQTILAPLPCPPLRTSARSPQPPGTINTSPADRVRDQADFLAIHVGFDIRAQRVVEIMRSVPGAQGFPVRIQVHNAREFVSRPWTCGPTSSEQRCSSRILNALKTMPTANRSTSASELSV